MDKVKILHCGDIHFDTPFSGLNNKAKAEIRREDLRETFLNIITLADTENVDALLIAGDLFDSGSVTGQTINFILDALKRISHIPVFISPGNHDPYTVSSYYSSVIWPDNVHIFDGNITFKELPDKHLRIYGTGFISTVVRRNLLEGFSSKDDGFINILLMHGDIYPTQKDSDYNPVTEHSLYQSGIDYAAFGHRHEFSGIQKTGRTSYAYSGSPEGRGFDELGEKGVILGTVSKKSCSLDFVRTCKRVYKECHLGVENCQTYDQLCNSILGSIGSDTMKSDLYKIIVTGTFSSDFTPSPEVVLSKISENMFFSKLEINSLPSVDIEQLKSEYCLKGIFIKKMLERIAQQGSEKEKEIAKRALYLGIDAFDKKGVAL